LWALDCLPDIGDHSVAPAAHLVAEEPEASRPAASDSTFDDNATLQSVVVSDWRLLDHEPTLRHARLKRRVIEIARRPPPDSGGHRLEDAPV
jgi:hypothetical protein